jgi:hypothetical protein
MKGKFTRMQLFYSAQAKSLQQTIISYNMKILAYERLSYMKRRSVNVEKQYIYIIRAKLRVKDVFLAP